jgi:4-amino-4-deoxy-L-arabinose transferase-like glycosyltransferase
VNQPTPAIVAQSAVRRLPRMALLLLCAAYVLAGFWGRAPWKSQDLESLGFMLQLAQPAMGEVANWFKPSLLGQTDPQLALLPYWLGAGFIQLAPTGWEDVFARMPFVAMLALTLAATWYAVYALARHPAAQPVAFAFGGEAKPADYARALADGGLLALIACLGLARLAHEATPALSQLCFASLIFVGLSTLPRWRIQSGLAIGLGMLGLTLSGAPLVALWLGVGGSLIRAVAAADPAQGRMRMRDLGLLALLCLLCITMAGALDLWRWRLVPQSLADLHVLAELMLWFTWPAWPLALWALWRWRAQLSQVWRYPHLALPLWFVLVTVGATWLTGLSDRALLLALPGIAALAAFALPTLRRSLGALIDWFTLLFFSFCALTIWVIWVAMQTGFPAKPAANVSKLAPGFLPEFSAPAFALALLATLAWAGLVKWRIGKHRAALWKSMVLPAAGAVLCWLLLMSLWLPLLNFARSYGPTVQKVQMVTGTAACLQYAGISQAQGAALLFHAQVRLQAASQPSAECPWLVMDEKNRPLLADRLAALGWTPEATAARLGDRSDRILIYRPATPIKNQPPAQSDKPHMAPN